MNDRAFSDSVQYAVVKANLEKNDGLIKCEMCGKQLHSISDCHFDHIIPYAKGGKSIKENCQILCINCNLSKSDKQLKEFALEEKAKAFLRGESITETKPVVETPIIQKTGNGHTEMSVSFLFWMIQILIDIFIDQDRALSAPVLPKSFVLF